MINLYIFLNQLIKSQFKLKKHKKMSEDCVYKVLLLGDSTVGKTCFLMKYTDKSFQEVHMSTIGLDYRLKTMTLKNGKNIKLQIWDTAGQDRFRAITKNYYKGANGIILIYDVTSIQTYENVKNWITQIREEASKNVVIYIAGNKIDMEEERKVTTEEGQKLADVLNLRTQANTSAPIAALVPQGEQVQVTGRYNDDWYIVRYNERMCFAASQYLQRIDTAGVAEPAE